MVASTNPLEALTERAYKYGFVTDIDAEIVPPGLNEDVIRLISAKKHEPDFLLEWRLRAYRYWQQLEHSAGEPRWANVTFPPIHYQDIIVTTQPKGEAAERQTPRLVKCATLAWHTLRAALREQTAPVSTE
jgi:Fe-S cluster assembly protein SufB